MGVKQAKHSRNLVVSRGWQGFNAALHFANVPIFGEWNSKIGAKASRLTQEAA